ncbi:MAG: hypothetical protein JNK82_24460 [Myxococcaceae bacterium]|nr:hypothetical protein [Myxococcaceae bacterium]
MSRVPPSNRPPPPPMIRQPRRPRHVEHRREIKQEDKELENEDPLEFSGEHVAKAHEENAREHADAMGWTTESHAEAHDKKADREEALAESQREDEDGHKDKQVKQTFKTTTEARKTDQKHGQQLAAQQKKDEFQAKPNPTGSGLHQQLKPGTPAFGSLGVSRTGLSEAVSAASTTSAVKEAAERALKSGKPPDAFTLLNQAEPHGVFFKEDSEREGHSEDQEDPELRAAVEEAIRVMFGVRGIMRIGPGRNQADEPVIVIVTGQGFGEAQMAKVPERVHRFTTVTALPFDVLPLKKDR